MNIIKTALIIIAVVSAMLLKPAFVLIPISIAVVLAAFAFPVAIIHFAVRDKNGGSLSFGIALLGLLTGVSIWNWI